MVPTPAVASTASPMISSRIGRLVSAVSGVTVTRMDISNAILMIVDVTRGDAVKRVCDVTMARSH